MHGIIFAELKRYTEEKLGTDGWENVLSAAKLPFKTYLLIQPYPDQEALALVGTIATKLNKSVPKTLEDFGTFIAPTLMTTYRRLIEPSWKTLDLLLNVEDTIHTVVRLRNTGATPPALKAHRNSPQQVTIFYNSERKMCHLAVGIIKGIAQYYNENLSLRHPRCMHTGSPQCEMIAKVS